MTDARRTALPRPTDRLALGALEVSPFCVGMVVDPETIDAAFDAGINFFFVSADMHWPRYEPARRGLARLLARVPRERVVIAAAAYVTQPEFCTEPFRELRDAIPGAGYLDVLVAGGAYGVELPGRWPVYLRHRGERLCGARAIGASFHDRRAAAAAIRAGELDVAFVRYNAGHPGAQLDVFPHLAPDRRTRVFGFTSTHPHRATPDVDEDVWIPEVTDHYRFALSRAALDGLLCSPTEPAHVAALVGALEDGPLSVAEEEHMIELAARGQ